MYARGDTGVSLLSCRVRAWRALLTTFLLLASAMPLRAQNLTVVGRVRTESGRGVAAATVLLHARADTTVRRSTETDALGSFRLNGIAPGAWTLLVQRLGYEETTLEVMVAAPGAAPVEIVLRERAIELPGVEVAVTRERARFDREAGTTTRELTREEMKRVPGVAEADVLRAIEVLPGVVSTSDYTSAFNVRGGSADQNLILLDGLPIYNPFHLGGLFSVFNADVVSRAELQAGGFPAEHGGRIASVLSVESDASGSGTTVDAGLSLLATRVALGVPVPDGAAHALGLRTARTRLSLRRSYFDQVLKPFLDFPYHLTDLQLFAEGWTPGGARVTLTAYSGRDVLDFAGVDSFPLRLRWAWGNDVIGGRWMKPLGAGRTLDLRAGYTRFATDIRFPDFDDTEFRSRIDQYTLRADLEMPAGEVRFRSGLAADRLAYDNLAQSGGTEFRRGRQASWLLGAYAQADWQPGAWRIQVGVRTDAWPDGAMGAHSDAVVSPRLALKRLLGRNTAIKVAAGRYTQFLHSLRDEELPLGIDIWVLSGPRAPRTVSDQWQLGLETYALPGWYASIEAYDRRMDGVATNNFADDPNSQTDDLLPGTGRSYGGDLFIRRDGGRVRPALAVSWLRARRRFPDTTSPDTPPPAVSYPPIFDRRVDIEFTLQTTLGGAIDASLRWNFGSGLPYTRPRAGYTSLRYGVLDGLRSFDGNADSAEIAVLLGARNAQRYPNYHRLDIGFRRTYRKSWGELQPYLDILNVYNRKNPLFYFYEYDRSPAIRSGVSMFPFLPTFGVEVRF
jgi:hypothetical protein